MHPSIACEPDTSVRQLPRFPRVARYAMPASVPSARKHHVEPDLRSNSYTEHVLQQCNSPLQMRRESIRPSGSAKLRRFHEHPVVSAACLQNTRGAHCAIFTTTPSRCVRTHLRTLANVPTQCRKVHADCADSCIAQRCQRQLRKPAKATFAFAADKTFALRVEARNESRNDGRKRSSARHLRL